VRAGRLSKVYASTMRKITEKASHVADEVRCGSFCVLRFR
jgi:hypothetical protein